MKRKATGHYTSSIAGGETIRAFVPSPLPPDPALDLSGARQTRLARATAAVGRLDSVSMLLPDPQRFLYTYVRREAVLSSQIEGAQSSLSDLLLYELDEIPGVPMDDVVEVSNYVAALEHGMARMREGFPLTNRLLREMHTLLMDGARGDGKAPGQFRKTQNWIGGTRPGNAHFVPPPPQEVEACMGALETFIHGEGTVAGGARSESDLPVLIRAALAHVQFETIHPFLDGNGRLGRLLIALLLHHGGLLDQPLLYLSLYFKQHRAVYYERLDAVRAKGDWEGWIDFFLEGAELTAQGAVATAQRIGALFNADNARTEAIGKGAPAALRLLAALRERPLSNLTQLGEHTGLSYPTVSKAMKALIGIRIARELTGKRRNRVFVYDQYLAILNEGGEPLSR